MLCYILAQYAPQVHENILLFFRHKKQSHRNCCRILNINLVIGICKFISSKLQMIPTPARHLQIQFQQIADTSTSGIHPYMYLQVQFQQVVDASNPDQASANPIPASCRCFRPQDMHLQIQFQQIADASEPRICIYKSNSSKLQMLPTPARHLQIQFQQIADASNSNQASANPIPASCRCFQPQPGIYKSNSSKLQMLPTPGYVSAKSYPTNCRCFRPRPGICKSNSSKLQMLPTPTRHLQIQFQQVADASDPDQASTNPIPASCRCFRPRPGICKSNSSKLQMLPTLTRHL